MLRKNENGPSPILHEKYIRFNLFGSSGYTIHLERFISELSEEGQKLTEDLSARYMNNYVDKDDALTYFGKLNSHDSDIMYRKYSLFYSRLKQDMYD